MASRDLWANIDLVTAIQPGEYLLATDPVPVPVDVRGYESVTLALAIGDVTDAQALVLEESNDGTVYVPVVEDDVIGGAAPLAAFLAVGVADAGTVKTLGYKGSAAFLEVSSVAAGVAGAVYGVVAILGHPAVRPQVV